MSTTTDPQAPYIAAPAPLAGAAGEGETPADSFRIVDTTHPERIDVPAKDVPDFVRNLKASGLCIVAIADWEGLRDKAAEATTLRARLAEETRAAAEQRMLADAMRENLESYRVLLPKADERYAAEVAAHAETSAAYTGALKEWKEAAGNADRLLRERNAARQEAAEAEREKLALHEELRGLRAELSDFKESTLAGLKEAHGQGDWFNVYVMIEELAGELLEARGLAKGLGADLGPFNKAMAAAALPLVGDKGKEGRAV